MVYTSSRRYEALWTRWSQYRMLFLFWRMHGNDEKTYEVGLMLKPSRIDVRKIRKIPELSNKTLHHWYHTVTYQNLSVKEIKFSVENADTLKLLDIEYSPIENVCDLDFDVV